MKRLIVFFLLLPVFCSRKKDHAFSFFLERPTPVYLFTMPDASGSERYRLRSEIVKRIDAAEHEIVFWFYGLDDPEILSALKRAAGRRVRLTLTGSPDQNYEGLQTQKLPFRVRAKSGLQHAKLMMIDRKILISGTGNFTRSGMMYNNNLFFISQIPESAALQILKALEFEEQADLPISWEDHGAIFRMMIAPRNGRTIQSELVQSILQARSVRVMIYSFTDTVIATAMLAAARNGTSVEVVIESKSNDGLSPNEMLHDVYGAAGTAPFFLYADGNERVYYAENSIRHGGKMHHKTMILDDRILTGSYNYTLSARDSNLETFFEIRDLQALPLFHEEFHRVLSISTPVARPPYTPAPYSETLTYENGQLCTGNRTALLFRGHGAFFRGLLFVQKNCNPSYNSAGFQSSAQFDPGATGILSYGHALVDFRHAVISEHIPESLHHNAAALPFYCDGPHCDPCTAGMCRSVKLDRISLSSGWLYRSGNTHVKRLFLLHRNGLEEAEILQQIGSFLRFRANAGSSALLFFYTEDPQKNQRIEIACAAASLSSAPSALRNILLALPWFYPAQFDGPVACTVPDESI
jgi:phosphatidylserine/phosphatidylglycerophosphate/cardiolipin synthase-like enzyme